MAVDNTANLYESIIATVGVKTSATALANDKGVYVYVYGSEDGTNYNASGAEAVGTDAAVTLDSTTNMVLAGFINCPTTSQTYRIIFDVIQVLGFVPRKWGIVVRNYTGQALDSTEGNHQKTFTGVGRTIT